MTDPAVAPGSKWQQLLAGRTGMIIAFLWGLAEATFFFVIPDVFLSLVAILAWPRTWRHILSAIAGALLGGALLFYWASANPLQAHRAISNVPFVQESMFAKVHDGFRRQGLPAVFFGSVSGIPYKLYAVEAPQFCGAPAFLIATPPARAVRFLLVWLAFGALATWLRSRWHWQTKRLVSAHAVIWIVSYAFYWGRIVLG